jgi:phosphopantothenoylcysteine decarboxylase/phosphopantothenate--cysteine ligase
MSRKRVGKGKMKSKGDLKGFDIILGLTGSAAIVKVEELIKMMRHKGANVIVVITHAASRLIKPRRFQKASGNRVVTSLFRRAILPDGKAGRKGEIEHVSLAERADILVIAPATANILGKLANGLADDMLTTVVLATKAPVLIVPAMNTNMYQNQIVQQNIAKLKARGFKFVGPEYGRLASGIIGMGRAVEPSVIMAEIEKTLKKRKELAGRTILITAGPTQEPLDPVRFISNRSSGRMGYALASDALDRGAEVVLVTGPVQLRPPEGADTISVQTARQMAGAVSKNFARTDIVISAAAISDWRPKQSMPRKVKSGRALRLELEPTEDVLADLGSRKGDKILVGFALETENLVQNAKVKLVQKNLDLIVANDASQSGRSSTVVKIIDSSGRVDDLPELSKMEAAQRILDRVVEMIEQRDNV